MRPKSQVIPNLVQKIYSVRPLRFSKWWISQVYEDLTSKVNNSTSQG